MLKYRERQEEAQDSNARRGAHYYYYCRRPFNQ